MISLFTQVHSWEQRYSLATDFEQILLWRPYSWRTREICSSGPLSGDTSSRDLVIEERESNGHRNSFQKWLQCKYTANTRWPRSRMPLTRLLLSESTCAPFRRIHLLPSRTNRRRRLTKNALTRQHPPDYYSNSRQRLRLRFTWPKTQSATCSQPAPTVISASPYSSDLCAAVRKPHRTGCGLLFLICSRALPYKTTRKFNSLQISNFEKREGGGVYHFYAELGTSPS